MFLLYKLFARCYQACFKLAIPLLPYRDPIIIHSADDISSIINEGMKPLIVTDKSIINNHLLEYVTKPLEEKKLAYSIYDGVCPNPTSNVVYEALKQFRCENCNCFIAVGGGSVIDSAKAIGALYVRPKKKLANLCGILHVRKKYQPLLLFQQPVEREVKQL